MKSRFCKYLALGITLVFSSACSQKTSSEENKMDPSTLRSPPFQIGDPLDELTRKDFSEVFPNEEKLLIEPVGGGLSGAGIHRVTNEASGKRTLVRHSSGIFGPKELHNEFAIQESMGELGVSPKIHYSDPERGIIAMDWVENQLKPGRDPSILKNIPNSLENLVKLIRKVHQSPKPNSKLTHRIALDYIKRSYLDLPKDFLDPADAALLKRIVETPWPTGAETLTHNDFRSDNLLYDGERFWLIDWELGGLSHPFYDLAYFANYQTLSPAEGEELLVLYLERTATEEELKSFRDLRRIAFGFSATLALPGLAEMGDEVKQPREGEPSFNNLRELWLRIDEGSLDFDVPRDEYRISLFLLRASAKY